MVLAIHQDEYISVMGLDMQYVESVMGKNGKRSKKMIKTDKAVCRTRTLKEYDWLMEKLGEAGCVWIDGRKPVESVKFFMYKSDTCIFVKDKKLTYSDFDFYKNESDYKDYEFIEVSDLMETEKETDAQDKTEKETDALEELEAIHKQVSDQIEDLRKQGKEPKAIEYTIKVCFE